VNTLAHFPLAIAQAGAYIASGRGMNNQDPFKRYLKDYHAYPQNMLQYRALTTSPDEKSVLTTWEISYTVLSEKNSEIADILHISGFLSRNSINPNLFLIGDYSPRDGKL
jgi:hypothetical protein